MMLGIFGEEVEASEFSLIKFLSEEEEWHSARTYFKVFSLPHLKSKASIVQHMSSCCTIVSYARIDNRKDLAALLGIPYPDVFSISPSELILKAYEKWGKDCVHHLLGDWAFALWDEAKQELFVARDPIGSATIYYYQGHNFFIFSSDIKEILSHSKVSKILNPNAIIQLADGFKKDAQTFYKGILQLTPGHYLIVVENNVKLSRYWTPGNFKEIRYANDEDYVHHFTELFTEAVRCRIDEHKTGIAMSSGLDSGSVAVLAAPFFAQQGRTLEAFSWRANGTSAGGVFKHRTSDEVPLVKQIIEGCGHIHLNIVESRKNNVMEVLRRNLDIFQQPSYPYIHIDEIYESARENNIKNIFFGHWGNHTISNGGRPDLFFKNLLFHRPHQLVSEIFQWKKTYKTNWLKILYSAFIQPLVMGDSRSLKTIKKKQNSYLNEISIQKGILNYEGLSPDIELLRKKSRYPLNNLYNIYQSSAMGEISTFSRAFGMEVSIPTMDQRIIEFCLGIPNDQYLNSKGNRLLIKRAMENKMPPKVLHAAHRGMQGVDLPLKMKAEAAEIGILLQQFRKSPLASHWLDLDTLDRYLKEVDNSSSMQDKSLFLKIGALQAGLTLGLFLTQLDNG